MKLKQSTGLGIIQEFLVIKCLTASNVKVRFGNKYSTGTVFPIQCPIPNATTVIAEGNINLIFNPSKPLKYQYQFNIRKHLKHVERSYFYIP